MNKGGAFQKAFKGMLWISILTLIKVAKEKTWYDVITWISISKLSMNAKQGN